VECEWSYLWEENSEAQKVNGGMFEHFKAWRKRRQALAFMSDASLKMGYDFQRLQLEDYKKHLRTKKTLRRMLRDIDEKHKTRSYIS
jgi:hypothetical protein